MLRFLVALSISAAVLAAQQRRIYFAPDDHTDYMWTGDEDQYRRAYLEMLDYYLDLADKTSQEKPEFQSRWHADGSFWIWTYERNKSAADFARLINRIRDGHISFPLNAVVSTYGGMPTEAVFRGMYYAGALQRRFHLSIPLAIANENQTLPYGLGALWAGSGAKYSWKGICGCASKIDFFGKRPYDIYWWKGADGSRVLMKWNALTKGRFLMGNYLEARLPDKVLEHVETDPAFRAANPYSVIGIFGKGGDDLKTLSDEFVTFAKKNTTPDRKVIVSNMVDFFEDMEKSYGTKLPEFSGGFGNEWDLYTASVTELSARVRRAVEKLRGAEATASLVTLHQPRFMKSRVAERDRAWMNLGLFWEHDWTADGPVTRRKRTEWGRKLAAQIENYVDGLYTDAASALAQLIPSGGGRRFYVFNPLGFTRSAVASLPLADSAPLHVVDVTSSTEVPSQFSDSTLEILAKDLPPLGYRVYEIRPGKGQDFPPAATANGAVLENNFYRIQVAGNGSIRSLVDKRRNNRELAGRSLNDLGPEEGDVQIETSGPVSVTLKASSDGPLSHVTRITLVRDSDAVQIRNEITQNFDGIHSWAFNFKLDNPDVWHEEVGAVIRAKPANDGGHYWPEMSRLDWLTLNHFAAITGSDGIGVTLSNSDLAFMKLGNSSGTRLDTKSARIQVLAGGQIDGPALGIHKQGGDSHFLQRFALRTHDAFHAADSMRFALEQQNPPVAAWLTSSEGLYPGASYSFLSTSNPNVLVWALKPAEDDGLIVRTWNLSHQPQDFALSGVAHAVRTSHIETDLGPADPAHLHAEPTQILTFRIRAK